MLMDPHARLRTSIAIGVCTGRVVGYLRNDRGVVCRGLTGPRAVAVPAVLLDERPAIGDELTYAVKIFGNNYRAGIATRVLKRG